VTSGGPASFPEVFFAQAEAQKERVAMRRKQYGIWNRITWREYARMVREAAAGLLAMEVERGDRVAVLGDNRPEWLVCHIAAMTIGAVTCGVYSTSAADQVAYVVGHSESGVLFVENEEQVDKVLEILPDLDPVQVIVWDPKGLWGFEHENILLFDDFMERGRAYFAEHPGEIERRMEAIEPDDTAMMIYTSGTTGRPKGVPLSQRALLHGGLNTVIAHRLGSDDRALCVLPLYHINGQVVTVIAPLVSGGSVVMPRRFSATRFWRWVIEQRCSWFSVVPTIIAYLLKGEDALSDADRAALQNVRFGRSASAPLPPAIHREFEQRFGIAIVETMGLTETAAQILSNPLDKSRHKLGSPGIAYGNQVIVADASGQPCAAGQTGELWVRGANVMDGYFRNPQATAEAITADGWLRTGDLGHRDADGYFFITGRLKELIIKGGENIAPREIDDVLYRHRAVLEAAAVGVADADYGQQIDACVVLKPGMRCDAQTLRDFCSEHLTPYKTPRDIYFLAEAQMPKGPSGKIQRLKLVDLIESGRLARA